MTIRILMMALVSLGWQFDATAAPTLTALEPAGGPRGQTLTVIASGTFETWPVRVWVSDPGIQALATKDKGQLKITIGPDVAAGVHWVRLADDTGASSLRPFLVSPFPNLPEVEPNDELTAATRVSGPVVANGKLARSGDVDGWAMELKQGQTLVAVLEAHRHLRSPMDAVLQIVGPAGTVLDQNHDSHGLDPQLVFPVPKSGRYVVRVFAFPAQPDSSIRHFGSDACQYRLTLTTQGVLDWVSPLAVTRGEETKLTLHGWNLPTSSTTLLATQDRFAPTWSPTTVEILREPHPCFDWVSSLPAVPLRAPFTGTGRIATPGARLAIPLDTEPGQPLVVRVVAPSIDSPLVPSLRILDPSGAVVATVNPAALHTDLTTTLLPKVKGRHQLEVRDWHGSGGPHHRFRLRVTPVAPDWDPTLVSDRLTLTVGQPLDVPVTLQASNGFAEDLTWDVEGGPPGLTVKTPTGTTKTAPKMIPLTFTAEGAGWSGPITLWSSPKGDATRRRRVTVRLTDLETTTSALWLTIRPTIKK